MTTSETTKQPRRAFTSIDSATARQRERHLLRAILWEPWAKWGPVVSEAIAWSGHVAWESELGTMAEAMTELVAYGKQPNPIMVNRKLHEMGSELNASAMMLTDEDEPLPVSCMETECYDLVAFYRNKKILMSLRQAVHECEVNLGRAREVADRLKEQL